jgi:hypothetical protein
VEFILNNIVAYLIVIGACRFAIYWIGIVSQKFMIFIMAAIVALNMIMFIDLINWCATIIPQGGSIFDVDGYAWILIVDVLLYLAPFALYGMLLTKYRLTEIDDLNKKLYFEEKIKENNIYDIIYDSNYHVYFFNKKQIDRAIKRIAKQNKR